VPDFKKSLSLEGVNVSLAGHSHAARDITVASRPAFSAYASGSQALAAYVYTRVNLNMEYFDTTGAFTTGAASAFQPLVPGVYQFNASVYFTNPITVGALYQITIYKSGSILLSNWVYAAVAGAPVVVTATTMTYLNGSTDSISVYAYTSVGGSCGYTTTCASACLL
jgi:hypothetical protein